MRFSGLNSWAHYNSSTNHSPPLMILHVILNILRRNYTNDIFSTNIIRAVMMVYLALTFGQLTLSYGSGLSPPSQVHTHEPALHYYWAGSTGCGDIYTAQPEGLGVIYSHTKSILHSPAHHISWAGRAECSCHYTAQHEVLCVIKWCAFGVCTQSTTAYPEGICVYKWVFTHKCANTYTDYPEGNRDFLGLAQLCEHSPKIGASAAPAIKIF